MKNIKYKEIKNFYANKEVLVTGSTGFVGSWLSIFLTILGSKVHGIGLEPNTEPNLFSILKLNTDIKQDISNINDFKKLNQAIKRADPEIVFHLAAQPLVLESYRDPIETFRTNVLGTLNVLKSCENLERPINFINITSDKSYQNNEDGKRFLEEDSLGGNDPYSASKSCADILTRSFALSFPENNLKIASARAGNIIGGGDWAKDRLITDIILSLNANNDIFLRNPKSIRPWQHVIDVCLGYLRLGIYNEEKEKEFEVFNFGPKSDNEINVKTLTKKFIKSWEKEGQKIVVDDNPKDLEANILKLNSDKANSKLGWEPVLNIEESISLTATWYKEFYSNNEKEMKSITISQIEKATTKIS